MEEKKTHSEFRRILRVWMARKVVAVGTVVILILIFTALFAPWLAPYDPYKPNLRETLRSPSLTHPLGTDALGRDLLSRIIYGSRTSLQVGLIAVGLAAITGMFLGLLAGYFGGWTERIIMRFIDAQMAFPPIVLALSLAFVLGGGLFNCMVAVGVAMTPSYVRLTRSQVLTVKEMDYITAARIIGSSDRRILFYHILHNVFPPLDDSHDDQPGQRDSCRGFAKFSRSRHQTAVCCLGIHAAGRIPEYFFASHTCPSPRDSASFWSF